MSDLHSKRREFAEGLILDAGVLPDIFDVMLKAWLQVKIPNKEISEPRITALWKIQCCKVNQKQYQDGGSQFDFFHEVQENDPDSGKQTSRKDFVVKLYGSDPHNPLLSGLLLRLVRCKPVQPDFGYAPGVDVPDGH